MPASEKVDTHQKALSLNLDASKYGSFAEIGAGQEVARWFLVVGAASGTVAKTISAYDKEVSDDLYGSGLRYVSRERLEAMLDSEWGQLLNQLHGTRGSQTRFFSFVDTVSARNYSGTNEPHGWVGLRFQLEPGGPPNDILLHINMRDSSTLLQQEAIGILGVNLIYAAFHQLQTMEAFLEGIAQNAEKRIEIDFMDLRGPAFETWDQRVLIANLVHKGLAEAVSFTSGKSLVPPIEILHKKAVVLAPGTFEHVDVRHTEIHSRLLASGVQQLHAELMEANHLPAGLFCLPASPLRAGEPVPQASDLLLRIDALLARGSDVMLFREPELYAMADFVNRYTEQPVRFVVGLSLLVRAFEDRYSKLGGDLLKAISLLFAKNVRIYAYPMKAADLRESIREVSATGWEWNETNGWVSASELHPPAPLGHLHAYLLASNFLVPMPIPAAQATEA